MKDKQPKMKKEERNIAECALLHIGNAITELNIAARETRELNDSYGWCLEDWEILEAVAKIAEQYHGIVAAIAVEDEWKMAKEMSQ